MPITNEMTITDAPSATTLPQNWAGSRDSSPEQGIPLWKAALIALGKVLETQGRGPAATLVPVGAHGERRSPASPYGQIPVGPATPGQITPLGRLLIGR